MAAAVAAVARKAHHGVGRFVNPWPSFVEHGLSAAPKMLRDYDRSRCGPVEMPVVAVDFAATAAGALAAGPGAMAVTWLGHATTLVQFSGGGAVLTDPILSERCSPISFVGPKRFTAAPVAAGALPRLDAIVLSHNHYDHTCTRTVGAIAAAQPAAAWLVPLGMRDLVVGAGVAAANVHELDWWGEVTLPIGVDGGAAAAGGGGAAVVGDSMRFVCLPCQHFSGRSLTDRFKSLWCSWAVIGAHSRMYFAGDTGYRAVPRGFEDPPPGPAGAPLARDRFPACPAFAEVGAALGPFDVALIPIGAYSPRWFMSPIHVDSDDAVMVHRDVRARQSVGIHWGTFVLTDEPVLEPPVRLEEALRARGVDPATFITVRHGEGRVFAPPVRE